MLLLLSPAKSLDYDTPLPPKLPHTLPVFSEQPLELIEVLATGIRMAADGPHEPHRRGRGYG